MDTCTYTMSGERLFTSTTYYNYRYCTRSIPLLSCVFLVAVVVLNQGRLPLQPLQHTTSREVEIALTYRSAHSQYYDTNNTK